MSVSPPLLLLHGALASGAQMEPLVQLLRPGRDVHVIDFPGHGGKPIPTRGLRMQNLADELIRFILGRFEEPIDIFGYSMGGYVATIVAANHPGRIRSLVTLGTKWTWSPEIAAGELRMLDPVMISEKAPALADLIARRHAPHSWETIVEATRLMLDDLGKNPILTDESLSKIGIPVTILRGEADRMVSEQESRYAAGKMVQANYFELPAQKHPFEQLDLQLLFPFLA